MLKKCGFDLIVILFLPVYCVLVLMPVRSAIVVDEGDSSGGECLINSLSVIRRKR